MCFDLQQDGSKRLPGMSKSEYKNVRYERIKKLNPNSVIYDCIMIIHIQIGKTKIFLRAGQMAELDARRTEVLAGATKLIQRQIRTYLTRKEFLGQKRATIYMQKLWRGFILLPMSQ